MTDQPDGDLFKAWGGCLSNVYELLMTDEHHHDWPLVHHQSARLQKCCMKPLQSLFLLILAPSQLAACGFTSQILTYPTCFRIFKQKKDCSQSKFRSFEPPLQPQWINVCLTCTKQRKLKHCNGEVDFYFLIMQSNKIMFTASWSKSVTVLDHDY